MGLRFVAATLKMFLTSFATRLILLVLMVECCCVSLVAVAESQGCQIRNNGLSYYCNFNGRPIHFDIDFKLCENPSKVVVLVDIAALDVYMKEEFDKSVDVPLPSFGHDAVIEVRFAHVNKTIDFTLSMSAFGLPSFKILEQYVENAECEMYSSDADWTSPSSWTVGSVVAVCMGVSLLVVIIILWTSFYITYRRQISDTVFINKSILL